MALLGTAALGSTAAIPERPAPAAASGGESAAGFWGALYRSSRLLLCDCRFLGCMPADSLSFGTFMLYVSFCGFVLQEHYALPLSAFGLVYGVSALALLLGTELSPRLSRRLPGANCSVLRAGLAVSLLGASAQLLCARSPSLSRSLWSFVLPAAASHFGRGLLTVQAITLALEGHPQLAGAAAGLLFAVRACLAGLCVWILGLLYDAQSGAQPAGEGGRPLSASPVPLCVACVCLSLLANDVCFYGCHARSRPGWSAQRRARVRGMAALDGAADAADAGGAGSAEEGLAAVHEPEGGVRTALAAKAVPTPPSGPAPPR